MHTVKVICVINLLLVEDLIHFIKPHYFIVKEFIDDTFRTHTVKAICVINLLLVEDLINFIKPHCFIV